MSIRNLRLPALIFLIVVLGYTAVGTLWLMPSMILDRDRGYFALATQIEAGLKEAQTRQNAKTVVEVAALLKTVVAVTPFTGVIILNARGRSLQKIGEDLPVNSSRLRSRRLLEIEAPESCCIDLYLKKSRTGFPYDLVARVDTGGPGDGPAIALRQFAGVGVLIVLFGGAVSVAMLYRVIVLPLDLFRRRLVDGLAANPSPDLPPSVLARRDVIGELARLLNPPGSGQFPAASSPNAGGGTPGDLIDDLPFEVLSFDAGGGLAQANSAALCLFHCQTLTDLQSLDLDVFQAADRPDGGLRSLPDLLAGGAVEAAEIFVGEADPVPRRIVTGADCDRRGAAQNLVVSLLATDGAHQTDADITPEVKLQLSALNRQVVKLKLLLESCLTLLATPDAKSITAESQPIRTDIVVEDWYLVASRGGLVDKQMEHEVPGQVVGDPDTVTSLVRHALTFVALRSGSDNPVLSGSGEMRGAGMVDFVFEEVGGSPVGEQQGGGENNLQLEDAKLPLAALSRLLAVYGGKVLAIRGNQDSNLIRFTMPARPSKGQSDEARLAANPTKSAA